MSDGHDRNDRRLVAAQTSDRLDELADAAELMGDDAAAIGLRHRASRLRLDAMSDLDDET